MMTWRHIVPGRGMSAITQLAPGEVKMFPQAEPAAQRRAGSAPTCREIAARSKQLPSTQVTLVEAVSRHLDSRLVSPVCGERAAPPSKPGGDQACVASR